LFSLVGHFGLFELGGFEPQHIAVLFHHTLDTGVKSNA
jgi:hypothetical protein